MLLLHHAVMDFEKAIDILAM